MTRHVWSCGATVFGLTRYVRAQLHRATIRVWSVEKNDQTRSTSTVGFFCQNGKVGSSFLRIPDLPVTELISEWEKRASVPYMYMNSPIHVCDRMCMGLIHTYMSLFPIWVPSFIHSSFNIVKLHMCYFFSHPPKKYRVYLTFKVRLYVPLLEMNYSP